MDRRESAAGMWFQSIQGIGDRTLFALEYAYGSLWEAYGRSAEELMKYLNKRQMSEYLEKYRSITPESYQQQIEEKGIRYITHKEGIYPKKLQKIPDKPYGIFVNGVLPDEKKPSVAMIGARACSEYGKLVAEMFGRELAGHGIQVISGMARGIDSIGQEACIKAGGKTFAVLGCGVDVCYPYEKRMLYEHIKYQGGLISTYAPGMMPLAQNFPPRNRIISGLADMLLVVEARKKSGTLITVDMALEQGKEVVVVPGRITDSLSEGCYELISQGAGIVISVEQLLEQLNQNKELYQKESHHTYKLNKTQQTILEMLSKQPISFHSLYEQWLQKGHEESAGSFREKLMELELLDLCKSNKNTFFVQ